MSVMCSHRMRRVVAVAVASACVLPFGASCSAVSSGQAQSPAQHTGYCAIMPDSVGLYVGNPVTQMGYQIGEVKAITPGISSVRIDFTLDEQRALPPDVKAITRSTSILADRSLELVGNYDSGAQLAAGECIALSKSATPKSLSEVVGSATNFINAMNPEGSKNVGDVVSEVDRAMQGNGPGVNKLLTTSSVVLDSPDQAISDIGSIITNLATLTSTLKEQRDPVKQILLDAQQTTGDLVGATDGGARLVRATIPLISAAADLNNYLGDEFSVLLDSVGVALRKLSAHAPRLANLLNPVPWWITSLSNHINNQQFNPLRYRPPLYRVRTPDGVALCNIMNASMAGSCANVQGTPYAVDVALLQYVLTEANR